MKQIRIVIVEDHALVRASLRAVVEKFSGMQVVAEAADGREALRVVAEHYPTVVLMDVAMPQLNGLEALSRMTKEFPTVRVVMVSVLTDAEIIGHALQSGAAGYVVKDASPNELELAIRTVACGETYLSAQVTETIVTESFHASPAKPTRGKATTRSPRARLTPRQREILQLVTEGHSSKGIAEILNMKVKTVEVHRTQLMNRLNIHDVAGLVRYAVHHKLIVLDK
jgi:DNA-binding NarL/FixJ family response regulator